MPDGEMEMSDYNEIKLNIEPQIESLLNRQLSARSIELDYRHYLKKGLTAIQNLGHLFDNSEVSIKQEIIRSTLRENLMFLNGAVRTEGLNKLIMLTVAIDGLLSSCKTEKENNFCSPSLMVARTIELSNQFEDDLIAIALLGKYIKNFNNE